jgi:hypothetical protein
MPPCRVLPKGVLNSVTTVCNGSFPGFTDLIGHGGKVTTVPSDKRCTARIVERKDLSEDLWLIRVDPGGPFEEVYFIPGKKAGAE